MYTISRSNQEQFTVAVELMSIHPGPEFLQVFEAWWLFSNRRFFATESIKPCGGDDEVDAGRGETKKVFKAIAENKPGQINQRVQTAHETKANQDSKVILSPPDSVAFHSGQPQA
jgi:hypothetical protein